MTFLAMFLALVFLHFLCDYPLQGDFLAKAKNPNTPIPGVPWWQALTAHAGIHAGAVMLATGSVTLGLIEWAAHWLIDIAKCKLLISFNHDQALHIGWKLFYVVAMYAAATNGFTIP